MAILSVIPKSLGMVVARMSSSSPADRPLASQPPPIPDSQAPLNTHRVNRFEKYLLVWTKKFKTINDVPAYVSRDMMERARNVTRIRTNLAIIAITFVGCIVMVQSGKRAAERGESSIKSNLEWHRKYNEENAAKPAN